MTYRQKKDMVYRMTHIDVWVDYVGFRSQTTRNLKIQIVKLRRLCWPDKEDFLFRIESRKKAMRLTVKNDRRIDSQYKVVATLVQKVFQEIATHKGEGHLTRAQLRERAGKILQQAEAYGRKHSED